MDKCLLVVRCTTYNHEKYIRQCLEGIVMQKTNFRFKVIVHDDASTDKTPSIVQEYADKYPNLIVPIFEKENLFSKRDGSIRRILDDYILQSKYFAYCEGDDYWVDPDKLQKQVDYLEQHPDVVCSCTRYNILSQNTGKIVSQPNDYFDNDGIGQEVFEFSRVEAFSMRWMLQTLTLVIRSAAYKPEFLDLMKSSLDIYVIYSVLLSGRGVCHNFIGGVYRKNDGGVFASADIVHQYINSHNMYCRLYNVTKDPILHHRLKLYYINILNSNIFIKPQNTYEYKLFFEYYVNKISSKIRIVYSTIRVKMALRTKVRQLFK